jgi:hypothetical protein
MFVRGYVEVYESLVFASGAILRGLKRRRGLRICHRTCWLRQGRIRSVWKSAQYPPWLLCCFPWGVIDAPLAAR